MPHRGGTHSHSRLFIALYWCGRVPAMLLPLRSLPHAQHGAQRHSKLTEAPSAVFLPCMSEPHAQNRRAAPEPLRILPNLCSS